MVSILTPENRIALEGIIAGGGLEVKVDRLRFVLELTLMDPMLRVFLSTAPTHCRYEEYHGRVLELFTRQDDQWLGVHLLLQSDGFNVRDYDHKGRDTYNRQIEWTDVPKHFPTLTVERYLANLNHALAEEIGREVADARRKAAMYGDALRGTPPGHGGLPSKG